MKPRIYSYLQILYPAFTKLYAPIFFFLFVIILINIVGDVSFKELTRDPISLAGLNPIFGIVSNVGVLLWCAATVVCFFSATIIVTGAEKKILFFSGVLSFFLMIDDFFVIHESLRDYFGVPQNLSYAFYVLFVIFYFGFFWKKILNDNVALLVLAFVFLGGSMMIDVFQDMFDHVIPAYFLIEDGLKLIGIASWAGYFAATAYNYIKQDSFSRA